MSWKGILSRAGIEILGAGGTRVGLTLPLVNSKAQTSKTGFASAAFLRHGSYTTGLAYGTLTGHLVVKSMHITAGVTGKYVIGDLCMIESSAISTGYFIGNYAYLVVGHTVGAAMAVYAEVDITATAALNGNVQGLFSEVIVSAGTITGAGKISGLTVEVSVTAGVTIAQPVHGIEVDMRGIKADVVGETIGIKVTMAGGANYLDYGMQFSNCFDQATAVLNFDLTQGNTAIGILFESGSYVIGSAIKIDGVCDTVIDIAAVQSSECGWDSAALFKHGTYSTALAYGTVTADDLILQSVHITAAPVAQNVVGSVLRLGTSAAHTGYFTGMYSYLTTAHNSGGAKAIYGEVDITATAALAGNHIGVFSEICVTAGTITGAGKIVGIAANVNVTAGVTIAQTVIGLEVDMRGIKADIVGETVGIKVTMANGANYLDYGMQFSNCFDQATAVLNFDLTQGNVACGVLMESGAHTITNAFSFTGTITTLIHFGASGAGIVHGGAAAATVSGYVKIMVGTTVFRIPYLVDADS